MKNHFASNPLCLILLIWVLQLGNMAAGFSQEIRKYDVQVAGINIGEMVAKKTVDKDLKLYEINSKVSFWFFGKVNVNFHTLSKYNQTMFVGSEVKSETNKGNFLSTMKWTGKQYEVRARNYKYENDQPIDRPFHYSAALFFFEEPVNHQEMIAEAYGLPIKIHKRKDHYEVTINGNTNQYYYSNGKMVKAIMEFPVKNYVLKLKE